MPYNEIESMSRELLSAEKNSAMVVPNPSARPGFDLDAAYAVEAALKKYRESEGHKAVGRKVGFANKAMWRALKLETLAWAHMYDNTVHYSNNNAATLSLPRFRSLKIEPEIVFGLKQAIPHQGLDAAAALACTDWLAIGFEIIDCPFLDWKFQASDFVASFGLHVALVIGEKLQVQPENIPTLADQLSRFKVRMSKAGQFIEEGSGKNSLKNPALCLAELATAIERRFPSDPLSAGEIVSTGTLTSGHSTDRGDVWTVDVEGLPLPSLTLSLA
jgi:2-keto-4-pentenoate hydratase